MVVVDTIEVLSHTLLLDPSTGYLHVGRRSYYLHGFVVALDRGTRRHGVSRDQLHT